MSLANAPRRGLPLGFQDTTRLLQFHWGRLLQASRQRRAPSLRSASRICQAELANSEQNRTLSWNIPKEGVSYKCSIQFITILGILEVESYPCAKYSVIIYHAMCLIQNAWCILLDWNAESQFICLVAIMVANKCCHVRALFRRTFWHIYLAAETQPTSW